MGEKSGLVDVFIMRYEMLPLSLSLPAYFCFWFYELAGTIVCLAAVISEHREPARFGGCIILG